MQREVSAHFIIFNAPVGPEVEYVKARLLLPERLPVPALLLCTIPMFEIPLLASISQFNIINRS